MNEEKKKFPSRNEDKQQKDVFFLTPHCLQLFCVCSRVSGIQAIAKLSSSYNLIPNAY